MRRRLAVSAAVLLVLVLGTGAAGAVWPASGAGDGVSGAARLPAGPLPNADVTGNDVALTWPTVSGFPGAPVGHRVHRSTADGTFAAVGSDCGGVVTGTSCTEPAVAEGVWHYRLSSVLGAWEGPLGPSAEVRVPLNTPELIAVEDLGTGEIRVSWTVTSAIATSTEVSYSTDSGTTWQSAGSVAVATTSFAQSVGCGETRDYRVRSSLAPATLTSEWSTDSSVTTADCVTWYRDADGDGYGTPSDTVQTATAPSGYVAEGTDCNDANATVYPGADEKADGVDNDCDGAIDDGVSIHVGSMWSRTLDHGTSWTAQANFYFVDQTGTSMSLPFASGNYGTCRLRVTRTYDSGYVRSQEYTTTLYPSGFCGYGIGVSTQVVSMRFELVDVVHALAYDPSENVFSDVTLHLP